MRRSVYSGGSAPVAAVTPPSPFRDRLRLLVGGVCLLAFALALSSHRADDAGFSTSGQGAGVVNWLGLPGAWVSDLALVLAGGGGRPPVVDGLGRHAAHRA